MGDSDDTYDFTDALRLTEPLKNGADLVLGSRFMGKILPGGMPWANRYIGNPILTLMLNTLFGQKITDSQSGFRAFTKEAWERMEPRTTGMEFASEMLMKAALHQLHINEVPITYYPRLSPSKLSPWSDAWRHIRFMLMFSPTYLFTLPGLVALGVGLFFLMLLAGGPVTLGSVYFGIHYLVVASLLAITGLMILSFGLSARGYAFTEDFVERDRWLDGFFKYFTLERGIALGLIIGGGGLVILFWLLVQYLGRNPADLERFNQLYSLHNAIAGSTLLMLGVQVVFMSFFLSLLELHKQQNQKD
jgi:hypothetical protein